MPYRIPLRLARGARQRLGRRGTLLSLLGLAWIAIGVTVPLRDEPEHLLLLNILEVPRAATWIVTGAVALRMAWRREDRIGWLALYLMAAYRALAYGIGAGVLILDGDGTRPELADACSRAATWLAVLAVIRICSGWREHPEELGTAPPTRPVPLVPAPQGEGVVDDGHRA